MYTTIKKIAKIFFPHKFIFANEDLIRSFIFLFYKGNSHQCNICSKKIKSFILVENGNYVCPVCGSIERSRRLWNILNAEFLKPNIKVLDFSPSRAIFKNLKKNKNIEYFPTDFENEFLADYHFDITKINSNSEEYDLIICYHILEHIIDDQKAISELYRVLKYNGTCLIQTPFKDGEIYEDLSIVSKKDRLKHYGQEDHVRIYSLESLKERLTKNGFKVEIKTYSGDDYLKLRENEHILICTKE